MKLLTLVLLIMMASLSACRGPRGSDGSSIVGPQGSQGEVGATGSPGVDATPVTLVKLCPETPSYGVFVEYGICLQGKLYAVYSQNGGFMSLLSNGSYTSNGIGSSCNLTVNGCVVTH